MPYVVCPRCALSTYSAARHSTEDSCPGCGHRLERSPGIGARLARSAKLSGEIVPKGFASSVRVAP
jgi:ribosomal protein S27E